MIHSGQPAEPIQTIGLPWGLEIEVNTHEALGRALWRSCIHDFVVAETIWRLSKPGTIAVDAGANIGYMTSIMQAKMGASGSIFAFEPHSLIYKTLERNIGRWSVSLSSRNTTPRKIGLSERTGSGVLISGDGFSHNQGLSFIDVDGGGGAGDDCGQEIRLERLDDLFPRENIWLIKIDVEGHELSLLKGAKTLLSEGRIRNIIFEDWQPNPSPTMEFIQLHNYALFGLGRTFWGPALSSPANQPGRRSWESPAYLATLEPAFVESALSKSGWQVLSGRII